MNIYKLKQQWSWSLGVYDGHSSSDQQSTILAANEDTLFVVLFKKRYYVKYFEREQLIVQVLIDGVPYWYDFGSELSFKRISLKLV